jgi:hypothetical protein
MKKPQRPAAQAPNPNARPARHKPAAGELTPEEALHLETISRRYEESERAWAQMTAPPDGDETWSQVEDHLLSRSPGDPDRRWKYFSK